jgi:hypothetical protein
MGVSGVTGLGVSEPMAIIVRWSVYHRTAYRKLVHFVGQYLRKVWRATCAHEWFAACRESRIASDLWPG